MSYLVTTASVCVSGGKEPWGSIRLLSGKWPPKLFYSPFAVTTFNTMCWPSAPLSQPSTPPGFITPPTHRNFSFCVFTTCFRTDKRIKWFCRSKCPVTDGQPWHWVVAVGGARMWFWSDPHCCWMWQNAKWNSLPPSVQNWPRERACERHDSMSFAVQASLGDSCDVYRPASMTVGGGSLALFRQELGLSSDSKILLIYDISTPVFSPTPLTRNDKCPAGKRWHSIKLFVFLLLSTQRINFQLTEIYIF